MHAIEPHYHWRNLYVASEDFRSPFFEREYSEFEFTNKVYNFLLHPQWDDFGSETLFIKIIFADYEQGFTVIEMIGEWNDCIENDIMNLKLEVIELLMGEGIDKFIVIGENVLNFHSSDDLYYEEWFDELEDGWIVFLNFHQHVLEEFEDANIDNYVLIGEDFEMDNWRTYKPIQLFNKIKAKVDNRFHLPLLD
jgi:hypothetical protein